MDVAQEDICTLLSGATWDAQRRPEIRDASSQTDCGEINIATELLLRSKESKAGNNLRGIRNAQELERLVGYLFDSSGIRDGISTLNLTYGIHKNTSL